MTQTDRHLLFGLLALQNEFIDKKQLIAAFGLWIADRTQALDELLVAQDAITLDVRNLLVRLVDQHVANRKGDVEASLRSLSGVESVRYELERLGDRDLTMSIAKLCEPSAAQVATVGQITSKGCRFQIRRPLDRGGLGVVSIALDTELNREVALKEIREEIADNEKHKRQFLREAEVTGGLEHPGIVPVYGLGTAENGRPYYAMRLVRGDNLRGHIKRFHAAVNRRQEAYVGPTLRKLLRRFLDICEAI
jgi:eukaryotic-like serine/threonine-protein kinase